MRITFTGFGLNPAGAQKLKQILAGDRSSPCAEALVAHATDIGAKFAVLEEPYTDQDYSSDYLNFYASAFKDHLRYTRRVHLFTEDISGWFAKSLADQASDKSIDSSYLGFVVVRPIRQGPIGRTLLRFPNLGKGLTARMAARAPSEIHLYGKKLSVTSAPFIQQDRRIGACAQAAIWMAARPMHMRHKRTAWHSIAEITRMATTPTDAEVSQELPAGSAGLNPMHIIRALKAMGHQPLHHYFRDADGKPKSTPASEIILRYLDSGLPVVLGMTSDAGDIAHAIAAVGYVEVAGGVVRPGTTYDSFVRALIVHDDQRGPSRLIPLTADDIDHLPRDRLLMEAEKVLVVDEIVSHMFVPLPPRVFLRAERADIVAADFLTLQAAAGFGEKLANEASDAAAKAAIADFYAKVRDEKLIRRTYLTSAGRYRHHLAKSSLSAPIKAELMTRQLPHFVWVTELMDPTSAQISSNGPRQLVGHMVVNATSSTDPNNDLLMAHLPHVLINRDINPPADKRDHIEFVETAEIFPDETPYCGRLREAS